MELFNSESKKIISDPINVNNPISLQVLGICSALAVTIRNDNDKKTEKISFALPITLKRIVNYSHLR